MGIFGTFLALGWIGGNLIKESFDQKRIDKAANDSMHDDRIYMKNGKWYDSVTGKRVMDSYIKDPVTGGVSQVWVDVYGKSNGDYVYNRGRTKWEKENEEWKAIIEKAQAERDPGYLKEAEENGLRFAKCVLPYRPGIRLIQEGYIDRMEAVKDSKEQTYYAKERYYNEVFVMRKMIINHNNIWSPDGYYICRSVCGKTFAHFDDKYMTEEEIYKEKCRLGIIKEGEH